MAAVPPAIRHLSCFDMGNAAIAGALIAGVAMVVAVAVVVAEVVDFNRFKDITIDFDRLQEMCRTNLCTTAQPLRGKSKTNKSE